MCLRNRGKSTPTGITASVTAIASNTATVTMTASTTAVAGTYYFKLTEGLAVSTVKTIAIAAPTVSLGTQTGKLLAGTSGSVTFTITTTNISDGTTGSINWYTSTAGTTTTSTPTGITISLTPISGNAATVTINANTTAIAGSYYFELTEGPVTSTMAMLTISIPVVAVSAGYSTTMILKADGSLWGTGNNYSGQLGNGVSGTGTNVPTPIEIITSGVASVSTSNGHTMILKKDGSLWATGYNGSGELGNGTTTNVSTPVEIFTSGVIAVSSGGDGTGGYTMILKSDGSLWATGENASGQLGIGNYTNVSTPVRVFSSGVQSVSAGGEHTMILKTDGSLWATGYNGFGALGTGDTNTVCSPVEILTSGVVAVAASRHIQQGFTMILKTDGSLWATGYNFDGELGNGMSGSAALYVSTPVKIFNSGVASISTGSHQAMIIKADGSLWATGTNDSGQFGNGTYISVSSFEEIINSGITATSEGPTYTMFIKQDGTLWTAGYDNSGGMGTNTMGNILSEVMP